MSQKDCSSLATTDSPEDSTYNLELAAILNHNLFDRKIMPTTTARSDRVFGKAFTSGEKTMAAGSGEEATGYRARLDGLNERLASEAPATTSTANMLVGDSATAPACVPKIAVAKSKKSARVGWKLPEMSSYAPLPGLGQTVNGEFVNQPGRYQGYGSRIPYASFVADYVKPTPEVEYKNVPGRYQGYGSRIPYTSFCSQYPGAVFTVKGEPDYSIDAQSNPTEEDDRLFLDDNIDDENGEEEVGTGVQDVSSDVTKTGI
ncbi:hypothetical protein FKW77_005924 [Venturia effusa]|uniref:Uncharacterized protein n=1 Tax=Venturia effusa TaxID=50376 RepID=A0A517LQD7_9PEZI|nr:hypothetical protein FKW77_005924 [Venturia effusa]